MFEPAPAEGGRWSAFWLWPATPIVCPLSLRYSRPPLPSPFRAHEQALPKLVILSASALSSVLGALAMRSMPLVEEPKPGVA
eukprot:6202446-Pleurochrysis_carterae.AAC.1